MSIDILVHAGTQLALHQWLDARGLGTSFQDTDATSPTFGEWFYRHDTSIGHFYYWRNGGKLEATYDTTDPNNPITTYFNGFYGMLTFNEDVIPANLKTWVENNTAVFVLESFSGVGGEGITLLNPDDVHAHLAAIGRPRHGLTNGMQWSSPELWAFQNTMTDDVRSFGGVDYRSLIDFNVWSPSEYPQGWAEVGPTPPAVSPWVQPTGAVDAYAIGDEVTHDNPNDGGNIWLYRSNIAANTTEPGRDATFDRWWTPVEAI